MKDEIHKFLICIAFFSLIVVLVSLSINNLNLKQELKNTKAHYDDIINISMTTQLNYVTAWETELRAKEIKIDACEKSLKFYADSLGNANTIYPKSDCVIPGLGAYIINCKGKEAYICKGEIVTYMDYMNCNCPEYDKRCYNES